MHNHDYAGFLSNCEFSYHYQIHCFVEFGVSALSSNHTSSTPWLCWHWSCIKKGTLIWHKKKKCALSLYQQYVNKYKNNWIKLNDKVGMAVPKNIQTRFVGITYHIPMLIISYTFDSVCSYIILYILILTLWIPMGAPCACTTLKKRMYSRCDTLSLQILFVYFLALPSLLYSSIIVFILWLLFFSYYPQGNLIIIYQCQGMRLHTTVFRYGLPIHCSVASTIHAIEALHMLHKPSWYPKHAHSSSLNTVQMPNSCR